MWFCSIVCRSNHFPKRLVAKITTHFVPPLVRDGDGWVELKFPVLSFPCKRESRIILQRHSESRLYRVRNDHLYNTLPLDFCIPTNDTRSFCHF